MPACLHWHCLPAAIRLFPAVFRQLLASGTYIHPVLLPLRTVAALLAFLAFRPGKGWLRRKGVAAAAQLPAEVDKEPGSADWKLAPSTAPPSHGLDSLLPSSSVSMPLSYATSTGNTVLRTPAL